MKIADKNSWWKQQTYCEFGAVNSTNSNDKVQLEIWKFFEGILPLPLVTELQTKFWSISDEWDTVI